MDRIAGNGVRIIIVESPDRFARDLAVQLAGHDSAYDNSSAASCSFIASSASYRLIYVNAAFCARRVQPHLRDRPTRDRGQRTNGARWR